MNGRAEITATTSHHDIGGRLRLAREQRGLSLADTSQSTKLSTNVLLAIERNEFASLPAGIYRKAYLRTLALEVGLDPDQIAADFDALYGPVVTPVALEAAVADDRWIKELTPPPRRITLTLAILLIFAAVWFVIRADRVSTTVMGSSEVPASAQSR